MKTPTFATCVAWLLCAATFLPLKAGETWPAGWSHRRELTVGDTESGGKRSTVAYADVPTLGVSKADGSDFRIYNTGGQPVRFKVIASSFEDRALMAFENAAKGKYTLYFGNRNAALPPESAHWEPDAGLILEVRELGEGAPSSWEDCQKLLQNSPKILGRLLWPRMEVNFNPLGSNDKGIYILRGNLNFPADGTYGFQSNATAASFLLVDGKLAVDWPGWHNAKNARKNVNQAHLDLKSGRHALEYVNFFNAQGACLAGWQRPGDKGFIPFPPAAFAGYSEAIVGPAETKAGPVVDFNWELIDDLGMESRSVTAVRFDALGPAKIVKWDFGDGTLALSKSALHVFLENGLYNVTCESDGQKVTQQVRVHPLFGPHGKAYEKRLQEYSAVLKDYESGRLSANAAFELGLICHEAGRLDKASAGFRAAFEKGYVPRDGEEARWVFTLYEEYRDAGKYDDALWVCDYILQANPKSEGARAQALNMEAEILYDYKDDVKAAADVCKRVLVECSTTHTDFVRNAYIRLGEYALVRGDRALARKSLEEVERAEKWKKWVGDIEVSEGVQELNFAQYLRANEFEGALQEVRALEWKTPTTILSGQPRYLRGKVFLARRQFALALREFDRALAADRQAPFAAEAVYAKGAAYEGLKETDKAHLCYQKVLKEFPESNVAADARVKLK